MSTNTANISGSVPTIPAEATNLDDIIKLPGLCPGMEVFLTGAMANPQDIHRSKKTRTGKKKLSRNGHFGVVLEVDQTAGSESITIGMMRSFNHAKTLRDTLSVEKRAPWMPISPAPCEEGMVHNPIKVLEITENNTLVENTTPSWLYVKKRFKYKVGTQLPGAAYIHGPTPRFFPAESLAYIKTVLDKQPVEEVEGSK